MQYVKKLSLIMCLISALSGCVIFPKDINEESGLKNWHERYGLGGSPHKVISLRNGDDKLIERFIEMYRLHSYVPMSVKKYGHLYSYVPNFNELTFHRVVLTSKSETGDRLFIFNVKRLRDLQAAFKVNGDNKLVDNFIISSF